ncbi:MAG: tRNA (adenosine(37)-N6)-threonylcarbamoyltransferase complex ATPase subunit type 1 TsaE [Actinomycetota bacterium]
MERPVDIVAPSHGPQETAAIAAAIAEVSAAGDVLVLGGDLGAGKTAFTKGYAAALGVTETVTSPTFTLAQRYDTGRLVVHHLDVYRIDQLDEVIDLALPELFESGGVVVIEWGDTIEPALPDGYLLVQIGFGDGDDERVLNLTARGTAWNARLGQLRESFASKAGVQC